MTLDFSFDHTDEHPLEVFEDIFANYELRKYGLRLLSFWTHIVESFLFPLTVLCVLRSIIIYVFSAGKTEAVDASRSFQR